MGGSGPIFYVILSLKRRLCRKATGNNRTVRAMIKHATEIGLLKNTKISPSGYEERLSQGSLKDGPQDKCDDQGREFVVNFSKDVTYDAEDNHDQHVKLCCCLCCKSR